MPKPLVVILPSADRDALRGAGVLPPAYFRDVGAAGWDDGGAGVRLWTEELARDLDYDESGAPPLPAQLLGLADGAHRTFATDRLVAKFFGTVVLHVVFLDEKEESWVGVGPVLKEARWARMFNRSVEYWFSGEQSRDIRHLVLVVARGGRELRSVVRVRLDKEQLRSLQAEFSMGGVLRTCYFIDGLLEPEFGQDALHAACLWPVLAGRLILRLLIALSSGHDDDVLCPGVHLWRSFEYLFDYPVSEMANMVKSALGSAYQLLSRETDSSLPSGISFPQIRNEEIQSFPDLTIALTQFKQNPFSDEKDGPFPDGTAKNRKESAPEKDGWHRYDAISEAAERTDDDERRWGGRIGLAREEFAGAETELFRRGDPALAKFSPNTAFSAIGQDPRNVAVWFKAVQDAQPTDTIDGSAVFQAWKTVVLAEKNRKAEKEKIRKAAKELSLAQAHYVSPVYGAIVTGAVSVLCGFTLFHVLWALGGNGAMPVAMFFSALAAAGAFSAWGIVSGFHRKAGQRAVKQFVKLAPEVDRCMDERHSKEVDTVRLAETQHRALLRVGAWHALYRLLNRVWSILSVELQSPTLSAFYRTEDSRAEESGAVNGENGPDGADNEDNEVIQQRALFSEKTRYSEKLRKGCLRSGRHKFSAAVLSDAIKGSGPGSFLSLWKGLCKDFDGQQRGNLPAKVLIPKIRCWLGILCDRLAAAQKADLQDSRDAGSALPAGFRKLRDDSNLSLATAHVDSPEVSARPFRVFVYEAPREGLSDRPGRSAADLARQVLAGNIRGNVPVTATPVLNGLPQVAFGFQDIRLFGWGRAEDGRLKFLTRHGAKIAAPGDGGSQ